MVAFGFLPQHFSDTQLCICSSGFQSYFRAEFSDEHVRTGSHPKKTTFVKRSQHIKLF